MIEMFDKPTLAHATSTHGMICKLKDEWMAANTFEDQMRAVCEIKKYFLLTTPIDEHGNTWLHFIVENGMLKLVSEVLSSLSVEVRNVQNYQGETLLIQAVKKGRYILTNVLLGFDIDVSLVDSRGKNLQDYIGADISVNKIQPEMLRQIIKILDILNGFYTDEQARDLIKMAASIGIGMTSALDENDNTLLHYFSKTASLGLYAEILDGLSKEDIDCTNAFEQTPLSCAVSSHEWIKTRALMALGADPSRCDLMGTSPLDIMGKLMILYVASFRELLDYVAISELLTDAVHLCQWEEVLQHLLDLDVTLDEPMTRFDNTLLHWLACYAPAFVVDKVLSSQETVNLDVKNILQRTPMFEAARFGREEVVAVFLRHGANPLCCDIQDKGISDFMDMSHPKRTVLSKLISKIERQLKNEESTSNAQLAMMIFRCVKEYIKEKQWQYDGFDNDFSNEHQLIDSQKTSNLTVNCYDLSYLLMTLFKYFKIENAKIHQYQKYKSKPFDVVTAALKEEFCCFDIEFQTNIFLRDKYYVFDTHCVVFAEKKYFDLTFGVTYEDSSQVLETSDDISSTLTEGIIDIVGVVTNESNSGNSLEPTFKLKFIAAISSIFLSQDWSVIERKNKIIIAHKKHQSEIEFTVLKHQVKLLSHFVDPELVAKLLEAWEKNNLQGTVIMYEIHSFEEALAQETHKQLKVYGLQQSEVHRHKLTH